MESADEAGVKASLTEAPLKMTGGDCHDTLTPLSLPNPASSGHTGMLTGAVAWNTDSGQAPRAGEGGEVERVSKTEWRE